MLSVLYEERRYKMLRHPQCNQVSRNVRRDGTASKSPGFGSFGPFESPSPHVTHILTILP